MAGGLGNFLGGVAQGYTQASDAANLANYRSQELKLQQQAQENAQERERIARVDKSREQLWSVISDTIDHAKNAGQDNATIAQAVQPLLQPLKRLAKSSGLDDTIYDAQLAALLSKPSPFDVLGGGSRNRRPAQAGTPVNPDLDTSEALGSRNQPASFNQRFAEDDVNRLTRAMSLADDSGLRQALGARLQEALRLRGDSTEVKTLKDENGNDHIVFVDKRRRTVTDSNGNPFVTPSGENSDAKAIVQAMKDGKQPPVFTGLYKNSKAIRAEAARQDFDVSQAQLEWEAAKKQVLSLNGSQMVRYAGLAKSVINTIDEVRGLSQQLNNSGVPLANKVKLAAYIQAEGNSENGQLAAKYLAGVNTLKEEFANLSQGGYAPTEPAWALANQQVNGDYGVKELDASLTEVQRLLRYRLNGIPNFQTLGPGANNRYVGGGGGSAPEQPASGDVAKLSDQELKARLGIQ